MKFIKKHCLFFLFLLGIAVRLSIIFYSYSWDVNNHMVWAKDFLAWGPRGFYETQSSNVFASLTPNYPPLAIFFFGVMKFLNPLIHNSYWWLNLHFSILPSNLIFFLEKTIFLAGLMKIPAILADLGTAFFVYLFAKKIVPKNKKRQLLYVAFVLLNPIFIYNSSIWGQIDSIPIFFLLSSIYYLIYTRRSIISITLLTLAFLVKPTILIFLPIYLVLFIKKFGIKESIFNFIIANIVFCLFFLPFSKNKNILIYPYRTYFNKVLIAQSLSYVTNGGFNFWVLITGMKSIKDTAPFLFNIPYRYFGYIAVTLINTFVTLRFIKRKSLRKNFFTALFVAGFGAFLFLTKMHERYSLLPLVFLLLSSLKKTKYIKWFLLLSLIGLINHYHSWASPRIDFLVNIIADQTFVYFISLANVLIFFYFFLCIFNRHHRLKKL